MVTKIYGNSDDLIESEGDIIGEYSKSYDDRNKKGILITCSDGTHLELKYGKGDLAVWGISVIRKGELFDHLDYCDNEMAEPNSDIAYFKEGLRYILVSGEWKKLN